MRVVRSALLYLHHIHIFWSTTDADSACPRIAHRWKISRSTIGEEYRTPLVVAPLTLLVSSLTLASIWIAESGPRQHTLYICGVVIRIIAILYASVFMWSASSRERSTLAQKHARIRFVSGSAFKMDEETGSVPAPLRGRSMTVSSGIVASTASEGNGSDELYGAEAAKAHLLSGINSAMVTYVILFTFSWIVSALSPWWASILRPSMDVVQFVFVGSIWALLRPREEHPYLLLADDFRFDEPATDWRRASHSPDAARATTATVVPTSPPPPPPGVPPPPPRVESQTTEFVPIGHAGMSRAQSLFAESAEAV